MLLIDDWNKIAPATFGEEGVCTGRVKKPD